MRQSVKPKHSWALLSPLGISHPETKNGCYIEKSRLSWVTEGFLLNHHVSRDKSNCQDILSVRAMFSHRAASLAVPMVWYLHRLPGPPPRGPARAAGIICHNLQLIPRPTPFSSFICSKSNSTSILPETTVYQALD